MAARNISTQLILLSWHHTVISTLIFPYLPGNWLQISMPTFTSCKRMRILPSRGAKSPPFPCPCTSSRIVVQKAPLCSCAKFHQRSIEKALFWFVSISLNFPATFGHPTYTKHQTHQVKRPISDLLRPRCPWNLWSRICRWSWFGRGMYYKITRRFWVEKFMYFSVHTRGQ